MAGLARTTKKKIQGKTVRIGRAIRKSGPTVTIKKPGFIDAFLSGFKQMPQPTKRKRRRKK